MVVPGRLSLISHYKYIHGNRRIFTFTNTFGVLLLN